MNKPETYKETSKQELDEQELSNIGALVVEEYGEYYNVVMWHDDRIHPLISEINRVHHFDESRHLAFGRARLSPPRQ